MKIRLLEMLTGVFTSFGYRFEIVKNVEGTVVAKLPDEQVRVELTTKGTRGLGKQMVIVSSLVKDDVLSGIEFTNWESLPEAVNGFIVAVQTAAEHPEPVKERHVASATHDILKRLRAGSKDSDIGTMSGDKIWGNLLTPAFKMLGWNFQDLDIQPYKVIVHVPNQDLLVVVSSVKVDVTKGGKFLLYIPPFKPYWFTTEEPARLAGIMESMVGKAR